MISQKLKKRVLEEATLLKQYATLAEINKLENVEIYAFSDIGCIYGRMTGSCYSERAHELLSKCAIWPYSVDIDYFKKTSMGVKRWIRAREDRFYGHSPIEYYIYHREEKIPILIDYLLGKRELKIEDL